MIEYIDIIVTAEPPFITEMGDDENDKSLFEKRKENAHDKLHSRLKNIAEQRSPTFFTTSMLYDKLEILFKEHLKEAIDHCPHYSTIKLQTTYWYLYKGQMLELLRLKCIIIGFNPDIWVDGQSNCYSKIQL